ncbi:ankyrin [Trametopsis cervina]|nr:ankyrin [Trametopsis cervina]
MSSYKPSTKFQDAAAYLSNATALANVSNTVKLELYGLFKYLTVSPIPTTSRPGIFDFAGRAKWDAWNAAGKAYKDSGSEAEQRYTTIARELGWTEGAGETATTEAAQTSQSTSESKPSDDIWDDDNTPRKSGGNSGMGVIVSTITKEGETGREEGSLHAFAMQGDAKGLQAFLQQHTEINVDEKDEYGYTPLHLACDRGHKAAAELLLAAGANPSLKDEDEFTALELARIAEHHEIVALLESHGD